MMREDQSTANEKELLLIKLIAGGDREAFREFYSGYERRLFSYLMKMLGNERELAEDLLIDIMLAVWQEAGKFGGRSKVSTWIFGIAYNKVLNALRKREQKGRIGLEQVKTLTNSHPGPQELAERRSMQEKVRSALEHLSQEHREVIELTFNQGFSYEEIAQIVRCPINTVKTRMYYAKQYLKEILSKMELGGLG
jgi:RNA polymerase sigma-70 factor, ECF subfamily